jgi:hypothetical protein
MDLSKLSDSDLEALQSGDLSKLSDDALQQMSAGSAPTATAPAPAAGPAVPDNQEPSLLTKAVGAAQVPIEMAMEHPGLATGAAGLWKASQLANKYMAGKDIDRTIAQQQANTAADAQALARERMAERMARANPTAATPTTATATPNMAAPAEQAAARTAAAAAPEEASFIQRGMQYAAQMRQIAAQKAMQGMQAMGPAVEAAAGRVGQMAAPVAEAAGVAGRALSAANPYITAAQGLTYSKDLGPAVPNKGPFRGMEINPRTNRPWTPQELAVINR